MTTLDVQGPGLRAIVAAEVAPVLAPLLARLAPENWPGLVEVKASAVRRVLHTEIAGADGPPLPVHVKLYRAARWSDRARDALAGGRAQHEFTNLMAARRLGLPCPQPLAAGATHGSFGSRSFLVTRSEPGLALPRRALSHSRAQRAGALLRAAHDCGLHARDLHAGNLLERPDGELLLLDLTSACFAQALEFDERARALAFFCVDLDGNVLDPAAQPLLDAYAASPRLIARAAQFGRRLRQRALIAFGRRALRACRHTRIAQDQDGAQWFFCGSDTADDDGARAVAAAPPPAIKTGRRGSVHIGERLVLKERQAAAARRLFVAAYWLQFAGVPCARPVALRLHRGRGQVISARLPLPTLAAEIARGVDAATAVRAAARLGTALGRMHAHGLRNRDLKFDNLVRDPETSAVIAIDLDGVHRKTPGDRRGQAADLGRLLAGFRDSGAPGGAPALRAFVRRYTRARQCLLQPAELRPLLRRSAARADSNAAARARS